MRKILYPAIFCLSILSANISSAQCPAGRYLSPMFGVTKSTVTYSTPYNLAMDIYEPTGDVMPSRPLIILGHGGSFIGGTKSDDPTVDSLCVRFARRGYVTASIDYRLTTLIAMTSDSLNAIDAVTKAIGDGKAAIRYFVKDAATTNTYKIDTNNIFAGGNSAGAVLYMHVAYLDESEATTEIAAAYTTNGGFEGNSGNPGYNTKCRAVINLAGALNRTSFVDPADVPSVNAQGSTDATVPYNCGDAMGGYVHVNLCGLGILEGVYNSNSITHWSKVFTGDAHIPWGSNAAKFNTVDSLVREFLYTIVCPTGATASVPTITGNNEVRLYPNPAHESFTFRATSQVSQVSIYDQVGRVVYNAPVANTGDMSVNTSNFAKGIYVVHVTFADNNLAPAVKKLVIE